MESREKARVREAKWRDKNREKIRETRRKWLAANLEKQRVYARRAAENRPWAKSFTERRNTAKKRGIAFEIDQAYLKTIWTGRCSLTGLPFDVKSRAGGKTGPRPFSPSVDRIRPELGYVPGNVRFVLHCVNAFRGTMSDALMRSVAKRITNGRSDT